MEKTLMPTGTIDNMFNQMIEYYQDRLKRYSIKFDNFLRSEFINFIGTIDMFLKEQFLTSTKTKQNLIEITRLLFDQKIRLLNMTNNRYNWLFKEFQIHFDFTVLFWKDMAQYSYSTDNSKELIFPNPFIWGKFEKRIDINYENKFVYLIKKINNEIELNKEIINELRDIEELSSNHFTTSNYDILSNLLLNDVKKLKKRNSIQKKINPDICIYQITNEKYDWSNLTLLVKSILDLTNELNLSNISVSKIYEYITQYVTFKNKTIVKKAFSNIYYDLNYEKRNLHNNDLLNESKRTLQNIIPPYTLT